MPQDGGVFASQVIEVNCTQSLNALLPMLVTLLPIVTDVRPEQLLSFPKKSRQVNTIFPKKVDSFLKT